MGMNHSAKVLNYLRGLLTQHITTILHGMAGEHNMAIPTMNVDCINMCFKVRKSVRSVASFLMRWDNPGICVILSCDTKLHPIRKQATNQCKANQDKKTAL